MDPVVANALKKKAKLEKQLADIERFLAMHRRFSGGSKNVESIQGDPTEVARIVAALRRPARPAMIADVVDRVLRRVGRPMTRGELAEAVANENVEIPSADKSRYLGTVLWRESARFENTGRGYWLKGIPIPQTVEEKFELGMGPMAVGSNRT